MALGVNLRWTSTRPTMAALRMHIRWFNVWSYKTGRREGTALVAGKP